LMPTPSCSYRCLEGRWLEHWHEPSNELPTFKICDIDGDTGDR
jgi:hypothetical protein